MCAYPTYKQMNLLSTEYIFTNQRISCQRIQSAICLKCLSPYQMNPHAKIVIFYKCSLFVNI